MAIDNIQTFRTIENSSEIVDASWEIAGGTEASEDMDAFFDIFKEFDDLAKERLADRFGGHIQQETRLKLFAIYASRME